MTETGNLTKRSGAYLPHWTTPGGEYHVVYRLADALPHDLVEYYLRKKKEIEARAKDVVLPDRLARQRQTLARLLDRYLDRGSGACWMKDPAVADIVSGSLLFFEDKKYRVGAWCVMPNHVHLVLKPLEGNPLPEILNSLKTYAAVHANRSLGRTGKFWHRESYDRILRERQEFLNAMGYVLRNPEKAGLGEWRWKGLGLWGRERLNAS